MRNYTASGIRCLCGRIEKLYLILSSAEGNATNTLYVVKFNKEVIFCMVINFLNFRDSMIYLNRLIMC